MGIIIAFIIFVLIMCFVPGLAAFISFILSACYIIPEMFYMLDSAIGQLAIIGLVLPLLFVLIPNKKGYISLYNITIAILDLLFLFPFWIEPFRRQPAHSLGLEGLICIAYATLAICYHFSVNRLFLCDKSLQNDRVGKISSKVIWGVLLLILLSVWGYFLFDISSF